MSRPKPKTKYDPRTCYGGLLANTRRGRASARPLTAQSSIHLVLRSSKARGPWSFTRKHNRARIHAITERFAKRHNVRVVKMAVVGNHLHLQIRLRGRRTYRASYNSFIRGASAAIAMAVSGTSRWQKKVEKFWDLRPFTRVVEGYRQYVTLQRYIALNQLQGFGCTKREALFELGNSS
jgi:REP element-mobilizing transposase RayT